MAVPPRHVGTVVTLHGLGADNEILEDLVQSVPNVKMPVGIGRTVVKNEQWPALPRFADFPVNPRLFPRSENPRFQDRQIRLHPESGSGKVDGSFQVKFFNHKTGNYSVGATLVVALRPDNPCDYPCSVKTDAGSVDYLRLNWTSMVARTSTGLPLSIPGRKRQLVAISWMACSSNPWPNPRITLKLSTLPSFRMMA